MSGVESDGGRSALAWNQRGGKEQVRNVSRRLYAGSACRRGLGVSGGLSGMKGQSRGYHSARCVILNLRKPNRKFAGSLSKSKNKVVAQPAVAFYGMRKQARIPGSGFARPWSEPHSFSWEQTQEKGRYSSALKIVLHAFSIVF